LTLEERFWSKVNVRSAGECWEWTKGRHSYGYGVFYPGRPAPQILAHRQALIFAEGQPPKDGNHALHSCDNPPCCNPAHLYWGTHAKNMEDMADRGRASPGRSNLEYCTNGGHPMTGDNVRIKTRTNPKSGKVYITRNCRQCQRETQRARRAQKEK
jgi:hypothetical protein